MAPARDSTTACTPRRRTTHTGTQQPVDDEREHDVTHSPRRSRWQPWDELLKRSFDIERRCPRCHSPMKLKSFVTREKSFQRLLSRLREPTDVQGKAPARGPPYFASQVLRQRFAEPEPQPDFFE